MRLLRTIIIIIGVAHTLANSVPSSGQVNDSFQPFTRLLAVCVDPSDYEIVGYGDVCSWSPGEDSYQHETRGVYIGQPALSPDGTLLVFLALPEAFVEASKRGEDLTRGTGPLPTNIGLLDLTRSVGDPERIIVIASQPDETAHSSEWPPLQRRSRPVWSPDGTQIAWIELDLDANAFAGRLMAFDVSTQSTSIIARDLSLGYADAGMWGIPALLGWGSVLAYTSHNAGVYPAIAMETGGFGEVLSIYDDSGHLSNQPITYFADFEDSLIALHWVLHHDEWCLSMGYTQSGWIVHNPTTGHFERLKNTPAIQAITGEGWVGQVQLLEDGQLEVLWQEPDSLEVIKTALPATFTPNGQPLWIKEGQIFLHSGEELETVVAEPSDLKIIFTTWVPPVWLTDGLGEVVTPGIATHTE